MDLTLGGAIGLRPKAEASGALMQKAKDLETAFLAEMLGYAGVDADANSTFGGGHGEEQFASFLRQEQARMMTDKGGLGLAEALFRAMGGTDVQP